MEYYCQTLARMFVAGRSDRKLSHEFLVLESVNRPKPQKPLGLACDWPISTPPPLYYYHSTAQNRDKSTGVARTLTTGYTPYTKQ